MKKFCVKSVLALCVAIMFGSIAVAQVFMPTFRGGNIYDFRMWVVRKAELTKEQKKTKGEIKIAFYVNSEGVVEQAEVLKAPTAEIGEIYRKVVESSPQWEPAEQRGKKVGIRMILPIK